MIVKCWGGRFPKNECVTNEVYAQTSLTKVSGYQQGIVPNRYPLACFHIGYTPDERALSCDQILMRCSCWCWALRTASARLSEWPAMACGRPPVNRVSRRGGGGRCCQPERKVNNRWRDVIQHRICQHIVSMCYRVLLSDSSQQHSTIDRIICLRIIVSAWTRKKPRLYRKGVSRKHMSCE